MFVSRPGRDALLRDGGRNVEVHDEARGVRVGPGGEGEPELALLVRVVAAVHADLVAPRERGRRRGLALLARAERVLADDDEALGLEGRRERRLAAAGDAAEHDEAQARVGPEGAGGRGHHERRPAALEGLVGGLLPGRLPPRPALLLLLLLRRRPLRHDGGARLERGRDAGGTLGLRQRRRALDSCGKACGSVGSRRRASTTRLET